MAIDKGSARELLKERPVLLFFLAALLATVGVLALQMMWRRGITYPNTQLIFRRLFLFEDYPATFLLIAVLIAALMPKVQDAGAAAARWLGRHPAVAAVAACAALSFGALWAYHAHPLSMDEYVPYLQSAIFANGSLTGQFPPDLIDWLVAPNFQNYFIHVSRETGRIASSYWPGFALLLTPFTAAGVPWLCNPVLGALSVLAIHRLALSLTRSAEASGTAALFALGSAAFMVNAISFYSITAHLLCNAVFVLLLLDPTPKRAALAGLAGGLALVLHNPVPHILFATPWLLWLLARSDRWRNVPAIALGYLPWIAFAGFGWIHLLQDVAQQTVVGATLSDAGPVEQAIRTFLKVFRVPTAAMVESRLIGLSKLWLWAAPALLLVAAFGFWRHRSDRRFQLLLASAVLTFVGFLFVPLDQGHGWGYRYFHSAWFVLPVLAAAAISAPAGAAGAGDGAAIATIRRYAQGAALGGLLVMTPFFAWQVHTFIGKHLAQLPESGPGVPRVVIVDPTAGYYSQDLVQNDPFLRNRVAILTSHGLPKDEQLMARHFPDLRLLSSGARGSVWGYPAAERTGNRDSGGVPPVADEHRKEK